MKVEKVNKIIEIEQQETIVTYDKSDIEQLILKDMREQGLEVKDISFITDYKYVSDEWGMNPHTTTVFNGATVIIE